ncbi:MAG: hypothetical protein M5R36_29710 [Deltaproteobacteria bacterium]|nr:hypothetical protein [Deltaproteobacteria bacterium]
MTRFAAVVAVLFFVTTFAACEGGGEPYEELGVDKGEVPAGNDETDPDDCLECHTEQAARWKHASSHRELLRAPTAI